MTIELEYPSPAAVRPVGSDNGTVVSEIASSAAAVILDGDRGALLFFAAEAASARLLDFAVRHSSGLIHAAMRPNRLDQFRIHDQQVLRSERGAHDFTVSVDALGTGTGISGKDRARTLRMLGSPTAGAEDFRRPGHVLPVRCPRNPVDEHDLVWDKMIRIVECAGFTPVAGACRLVHDSGDVLDEAAACRFADRFGLAVATAARRDRAFVGGA
ncbi:3,4-dihydroxy-2-butanone-4-phosphate synthase [Mycolicibacterium elephantis]|uniref:3,4-dihydroxy-2-butanone-4-phosphate synthase n=1 Tax=Mycolicibacterium elephantis DSM 44368 TaxID=1335622 RepID=A0A439DMY3_9MYCO|nr:3,4-dihydroxy-2-butanone-4-phosphate synthase [Mycolicibacterium elephantis]MCV7220293.1 3,4-dihydroxy-2-butanone-4-phosphate synthase [Mycolicibacterium elephantis]RWA16425.1 hypothetical protein MELE44368_07370 [Mycolicibacterium elephantis DSM 44368]